MSYTQQADFEVSDRAGYAFTSVREGDLVVKLTSSNAGVHIGYTIPTSNTLLSLTDAQVSFGSCNSTITMSNSRFGVGTTTPAYPVDIIGDLNFTGTLRQGGAPYVGSQWSNIASNVFILDSNIGIGLSNPTAPLEVATTLKVGSNIINTSNVSLAAGTVTLPNRVDFGGVRIKQRTDPATTTNLTVQPQLSTNGCNVFVPSGSNFGIRTSNPAFPLDVTGDINFTGLLRQNGAPYVGSQWSNVASNVFIFSSNIGIGTSNPSAPLEVAGTIKASNLNFTGQLLQNGTPYIGSQFSNVASNVFILSSNVGIGLSNPTTPLEVAGDVTISGSILPKTNATQSIGAVASRLSNLWVDNISTNQTLIVGASNTTIAGNVTINGNATIMGSNFIANVQTVEVKDNTLLLNKGETGAGVTAGTAGLSIDRGTTSNPYQILYQESTQTLRIGLSNALETAATREWTFTGLSNLSAANITAGTLAVARGGTGTTTSTGTGSVVLNTSPTLSGTITTSAPGADGLLIRGGSQFTGLTLSNSTTSATMGIAVTGGEFSSFASTSDCVIRNLATTGKLIIQNGFQAGAICINSNNFVGIRTATPTSPLEVAGAITASNLYLNTNDNSNAPAYSFTGDTNTGMFHAAQGTLGFTAAGSNSLTVSPSNIAVTGDIALTRRVNLNGLLLSRRPQAGTLQNITNTVTSIPALASTTSNITFSLSNGQSQYRFVDSNNSNVATLESAPGPLASNATPAFTLGTFTAPGMISAGNLGMFRNRIINGDMRIAQRGAVSTVAAPASNNTYMIDRFQLNYNFTGGSLAQSNTTLSSNDLPYQYGFNKAWRVQATTPISSYSNIDLIQPIEGTNMDDLRWGTAFGTPISVSFMIKTNAPTNSVLCVSLRNSPITHSYVTTFTVAASGSWQYVTLSNIPPPPAGTAWSTSNTTGLILSLCCHSSVATFQTSTLNAWQSGNFYAATTGYNLWSISGTQVEITGVQLEKGPVCTPFEYRPQQIEQQLCERYFVQFGGTAGAIIGHGYLRSSTIFFIIYQLAVPLRTGVSFNFVNITNMVAAIGGADASVTASSQPGGWLATNRVVYFGVTISLFNGGASAGDAGNITVNTGTAYVQLNAEL